MKIAIIFGTRPEIIKFTPIIKECQKRRLQFFLLHTKQHYAANLDLVFFKDLKLPKPKYSLQMGLENNTLSHGATFSFLEKALKAEKPDLVLVQGDTNSTLIATLVSAKLDLKIGHVEAGLRSFDLTMPEETNRIIVDNLSHYLFAPTPTAARYLIKEGIKNKKIFMTGNTIVDMVKDYIEVAEKSEILKKLNCQKDKYILTTFHRQENVDFKSRLKKILTYLDFLVKTLKMPIIFSVHPRTQKMFNYFSLNIPPSLKISAPFSFFDFLKLENDARLILTDSGGVQEEACILRVPCVTLRKSTERPETISLGSNILTGFNFYDILNSCQKMLHQERTWSNPFGDGQAADRIVNIIQRL